MNLRYLIKRLAAALVASTVPAIAAAAPVAQWTDVASVTDLGFGDFFPVWRDASGRLVVRDTGGFFMVSLDGINWKSIPAPVIR